MFGFLKKAPKPDKPDASKPDATAGDVPAASMPAPESEVGPAAGAGSKPSWAERLRAGLSRTRQQIGGGLSNAGALGGRPAVRCSIFSSVRLRAAGTYSAAISKGIETVRTPVLA